MTKCRTDHCLCQAGDWLLQSRRKSQEQAPYHPEAEPFLQDLDRAVKSSNVSLHVIMPFMMGYAQAVLYHSWTIIESETVHCLLGSCLTLHSQISREHTTEENVCGKTVYIFMPAISLLLRYVSRTLCGKSVIHLGWPSIVAALLADRRIQILSTDNCSETSKLSMD